MVKRRSRSGALCAVVLFVGACGPSTGSGDGAVTTDAAVTGDTAVSADVVTGDVGAGGVCSFNRECAAGLRCECSEASGCACATGVRGTGRTGVDTCTSGNDCASSLCVEGPASGTSYCSDECMTAAQCAGMLPRCIDVALVGRICARTPPSGG